MKKTILSLAIASLPFSAIAQENSFADELKSKKWVFSAESFSSSNEFTYTTNSIDTVEEFDSSGYALSFGFKVGRSRTLMHVFEYRSESFDKGMYDSKSTDLAYFSYGLNKEFQMTDKVRPYIRGSVGFGTVTVDDTIYDSDSAATFGLKVGAGVAYYPISAIKVYGGADIQARQWSSVTEYGFYSYNERETADTSVILSVGLSYQF